MKIIEWPASVNQKFYSGQSSVKDNIIKVTNLSGRTVQFCANEKFLKTKTLKIDLKNTSSNSEYKAFWEWYTTNLYAVNAVHISSLDEENESYYWQFSAIPQEDSGGQNIKTLTINLEQVYL